MKKFVITTVLALAPFFAFAQSPFDKFNDVEGIESINLDASMLGMVEEAVKEEAGSEAEGLKDQIKKIETFRMYTTSEKKYRKKLREAANEYLKEANLEQLMGISDGGTKIKIYIRQEPGTQIVKEGLLVIDEADDKDKEMVVIAFTGSINLAEVKDKLKF